MSRILIKRKGALGDVIEATAILVRLRLENPDDIIGIETDYPQLFARNLDHNGAAPSTDTKWDCIIDLNMAFENRMRKLHPIDAYSEVAFNDRNTPWELKFAWDKLAFDETARVVVFHAARSWSIRTLPREFWKALADELVKRNYKIALTGTSQDWDGIAGDGIFDMRDRLDLHQQAGLIDMACCFVCSESGPMILGQVTRTPIIPLLTMIDPEHITHKRYGEIGWRFYPIRANVPCVGCALEQPAAVTFFDCKFGHRNCLTAFSVKEIANKVDEVQVERAR